MSENDYHLQTINNHTFRMRALPGGSFAMGSTEAVSEELGWGTEHPIHQVTVSPFYIGEYLVTQALWTAVMGEGNNPSHFKGARRPVENVSWIDIVEGKQENNHQAAFLDRLNELTVGLRPPHHHYRLPTEAEWEYTARANEPYTYAGSDLLKEVGWYDKNSHGETKEVGLKAPNAFGLYDMSGNVWEWCQDWFDDEYYENCRKEGIVVNPRGPNEGRGRVGRGGSWINYPRDCRVAYRNYWPPTYRSYDFGFRLVLSPSSGSGSGATE